MYYNPGDYETPTSPPTATKDLDAATELGPNEVFNS
jgi:hypothetical protein